MTFTEIKDQVTMRTQYKVEQMKQRYLILPERLIDRCELCDQLSQEIYDYAVATLIQIVDRNHLHYNPEALLNALHQDFYRLSNEAIEVLFARQCETGKVNEDQNRARGLIPSGGRTKDHLSVQLTEKRLKPPGILLARLRRWYFGQRLLVQWLL